MGGGACWLKEAAAVGEQGEKSGGVAQRKKKGNRLWSGARLL
jgi:hypothetical protein